jgi:hypothetical protein
VLDLEGARAPGSCLACQGGFDLIWDGGPVAHFEQPTSLPSLLGAYNPRDQNQARRPLEQALGSPPGGAADRQPRPRRTGGTAGGSRAGSSSSSSSGTGTACAAASCAVRV